MRKTTNPKPQSDGIRKKSGQTPAIMRPLAKGHKLVSPTEALPGKKLLSEPELSPAEISREEPVLPTFLKRKLEPLHDSGFVVTDVEEADEGSSERKRSTQEKTAALLQQLPRINISGFFVRVKERPIFWGAASGVVAVALFLGALSTMYAEVSISIKPKVMIMQVPDVVLSLTTTVAKVNASQKVVPAERFEFTKIVTEEADATGKAQVAEKAIGTVRIFNNFNSEAQTIVTRTRFVTSSGLIYRTIKNIVIPAAEVKEGKVVSRFVEEVLAADEAGERHNVSGEVRLSIPGFKGTPKYKGFYAVASNGFSGGFKGEARVATKDDIKAVEERATKRVYDELRQEMARKVPTEFKVMDALQEIEITKVELPKPNLPQSRLAVKASAVGRMLVFRESDAHEVLKDAVLKGDTTKTFLKDMSGLSYRSKNVNFEKGKADLSVGGSLKVKTVIAKDRVSDLLKGKQEEEMITLLRQQPDLLSFAITFFPPWISRAPADRKQIHVNINEVE